MKTPKLPLKHILSVRCPMCGAPPKERCKLSSGHPSFQTHFDREKAAHRVAPPENFGEASLRMMWASIRRGLRSLFQQG
jgi:hypothetical protein